MKSLVLGNAKALVAFVCVLLASRYGLDVPIDVQTAIVAVIVAFVTWLVPNK